MAIKDSPVDSWVIHIVKRYGPVGGMERYVWELTHQLVRNNLMVCVVCEEVFGEPHEHIKVIRIAKSTERPRWLSMLKFRDNVKAVITNAFQGVPYILHSHERSIEHDITTFHSPPINIQGWANRLPLNRRRVKAWSEMEYTEVASETVKYIVPVSAHLESELRSRYPELSDKKIIVGYPGTSPLQILGTRQSSSTKKFLFVGKEWKRKGLILAGNILDYYNDKHGSAELHVFGPCYNEIPRRIRQNPKIHIHNWQSEILWQNYDCLIHPASLEPFGMVVGEARAAGIPVLTSTNTGSIELGFRGVTALQLTTQTSHWAETLDKLISNCDLRFSEVKWSWADLADLYIERIYKKISPTR